MFKPKKDLTNVEIYGAIALFNEIYNQEFETNGVMKFYVTGDCLTSVDYTNGNPKYFDGSPIRDLILTDNHRIVVRCKGSETKDNIYTVESDRFYFQGIE